VSNKVQCLWEDYCCGNKFKFSHWKCTCDFANANQQITFLSFAMYVGTGEALSHYWGEQILHVM
jgi:hypothetical protein